MRQYIIGLGLFALVGLGVCGFAASKAHAYYCTTNCFTVGGQTYCNQSCF